MNDIPLSYLFSLLFALIIFSAFFSGSETALMAINRYRLRHLAKKNHPGAVRTQKLLNRPDRLIGLILLGNNFVNILASSVATLIALRLYGESGLAFATLLLTAIILIFAEVTPKTFATIKPQSLAFFAAWIYTPLLKLFYPLVWVINLIANSLLRIFGIKNNPNSETQLDTEELKSIVADADTAMPERYKKMLLGILDLESATVEDIMTPRNEINGINLEDPIEAIIQQIKTSPSSRLPVYKKSIDKVIGIIQLRTIIIHLYSPDFCHKTISKNISKPYFIPNTTPLHTQIHNFKNEQLELALVVDEYGDVQGLVTQYDLLHELISEITAEPMEVVLNKDGSRQVDGSITIRELNRITAWSLPTEGPKTLNGLIIEFMETIPEPGTSLRLHGHTIEIIKRDGNLITQVKFLPKN
ncbi:MAG TPA: HlyC/CorC family transporter [Methylococcaceae bacterium]|nr:HlyC/CorC family transporter [Methylococcaceae bacterium]HIN68458.1 HlyC/CorC family transporter [Methylococcales bacterium]HIA45574.1 HlyC/CorC family transporter [Methylococcaceae bacterium]HIB63449.1 HlyC/CorC family transporter [Methylococcaceae bacterium]HIO12312.1 HlyC/CorC family transporter [Methylococcales bacterium]